MVVQGRSLEVKNKSVMLIDDDPDDFEIFSMALKEAYPSIECRYFSSAKNALQQLTDCADCPPDFTFLDLNMPGMNGLQFLEQMRGTSIAKLPVIVYSTSILPLHQQRIAELGVRNSFEKPVTQPELVDILRHILAAD